MYPLHCFFELASQRWFDPDSYSDFDDDSVLFDTIVVRPLGSSSSSATLPPPSSSAVSSSSSSTSTSSSLHLPPAPSKMASAVDITKVTKLNSWNFCTWRNVMEDVLILKDIWLHLDAAQPADVTGEPYHSWLKNQKHILAIIRFTCDQDVVPLIADATTSWSAWRTLASTFASKNSANVMRLEESFNSVRKTSTQSMGDWIACVKSLVAQLRGVGVVLEDSRVANRIFYGLRKEYESMRHALQARELPLTVDVVTEHLLSWDISSSSSTTTATTPAVAPTTSFYWVSSVPAQNNLHRGPMATTMTMAAMGSCPSCPHCAQLNATNPVVNASGPSRTNQLVSNFHFSPYTTYSPRIICTACGKPGHSESRCWDSFPHLRPLWLRDPSVARPNFPAPVLAYVPRVSQTTTTYNAHIAVDSVPPRSYSPVIPASYSSVATVAALPEVTSVFPVTDTAYV